LMIEPNIAHYFQQIYGDEVRFLQIFLNFLSNAFKFTPDFGDI
jgi:signal transduction histidine kinase